MSRLLWGMPWPAAHGWSFWMFCTTPCTGDSTTRGLNRLFVFMQWQMAAGGKAIAIWIIGRRLIPGSRALGHSRSGAA